MKKNVFGRASAAALAGVLALTLAACGSSDDSSSSEGEVLSRTIKVGAYPTLNGLNAYVAETQGFFEKEGLDVEIVPMKSPQEGIPQLQGGSMDFALLDTVTAVTARSQNFPLKAVVAAGVGQKAPAEEFSSQNIFVSKDSDITSLADLEGKKVANPQIKSQVWLAVRENIDAAGGDSSKVEFVETPDQVGALKAGDVDAATVSQPTATLALKDKSIRFLANYTLADGVAYFYTASTKLADSSAATVTAFERAILAANKFANENKDETLALAQEYIKSVDPEVLAEAVFPQWGEERLTIEDVESWIDRTVKYDIIDEANAPDPKSVLADLD